MSSDDGENVRIDGKIIVVDLDECRRKAESLNPTRPAEAAAFLAQLDRVLARTRAEMVGHPRA
mgnify:FL=1